MNRNYNYQAFTPEECKKGLHLKLIQSLLEISDKLENSYLEFHITSDGYCTIIEWTDIAHEYENDFWKYVDEDYEVMYRLQLPDNSYELCYNEEEADERLREWLKENPGWKKNEYGYWYNEKEAEHWEDQFPEGEIKKLGSA